MEEGIRERYAGRGSTSILPFSFHSSIKICVCLATKTVSLPAPQKNRAFLINPTKIPQTLPTKKAKEKSKRASSQQGEMPCQTLRL